MMQQSLDETVVWTLGPLLRSDGTVATDLTGSETWTWSIWAGDDQAPFATGSGTLQSPASAALLDITIAKSSIASLTPGIYRLQVVKNPGTDDVLVYDDSIKFTSAPGSAAALGTYCTFNDLQIRQSWVASLLDIADAQTGFAEQRHRARKWLDSCVIARVNAILESQHSRHRAVLTVAPIVPTDGVDMGPTWGPSILPQTTIRDQVAVIQGYLDSDLLMVGDIDNGQAADITAWYSLYLIALPQSAGASTDKDWSGWAAKCRSNAIRACAAWTALIDTDDDGVPNITVQP